MKKLYVLIGIPNSGKSTWTENLKKDTPVEVINMDDIRFQLTGSMSDQSRNKDVFGKATGKFRQALVAGVETIVWDNTTVSRSYRKDLIAESKDHGYQVIAVFFKVSLTEAKLRNSKRDRVVPEDVLDRMHNKLQPPSLEEGFTEVIEV